MKAVLVIVTLLSVLVFHSCMDEVEKAEDRFGVNLSSFVSPIEEPTPEPTPLPDYTQTPENVMPTWFLFYLSIPKD